jgi:hypothetical protein
MVCTVELIVLNLHDSLSTTVCTVELTTIDAHNPSYYSSSLSSRRPLLPSSMVCTCRAHRPRSTRFSEHDVLYFQTHRSLLHDLPMSSKILKIVEVGQQLLTSGKLSIGIRTRGRMRLCIGVRVGTNHPSKMFRHITNTTLRLLTVWKTRLQGVWKLR